MGPVFGPTTPLTTAAPTERSDAARNRQLLLDAAQQLVRADGVDALTMDALAKHAGVGKGTVFRRFGNRAGLLHALLDHSDRKFQAAFMFGPPPLGPGAPPVERLVAFGRARLSGIDIEGAMRRSAESGEGGARYTGAPYNTLKAHIMMLLRETPVHGDIPLLADILLAPLDSGLVMAQLATGSYTIEQIGDAWERVVRELAPATGQ
ncbi:TetR/AcrR family transcriptional regulator [Nocardia panacis]|uniref:TetR/AcrR family transcriptional regulator n=1 Tax=Nocardia panacis TaxID=2340916 RepID=A0A3A4KQP6_9NOCA|nr:TetR/AcrR family transcriptional regulator [Nocardia panacis]